MGVAQVFQKQNAAERQSAASGRKKYLSDNAGCLEFS
jgi:hypothetical protein